MILNVLLNLLVYVEWILMFGMLQLFIFEFRNYFSIKYFNIYIDNFWFYDFYQYFFKCNFGGNWNYLVLCVNLNGRFIILCK